ncbi:MAG: prepilin-type N-terminal cleavage/methylation domain-containing protein [Phycisphaerales bacterium]|nr:MAG: prepilin-type N-terminal cleavage/methylation domain-containing protein [Phycisphaerales bacterium]
MERASGKRVGRRQRGGFTIAEVMLVIIMIGLLASIGGGVWVGTYNSMLVKKAARDFVLAAKYARVMAIERQQPYKMTLDIESGGFFVSTSGWNEETEEAEETVVQDYYSRPVAFEGKVAF